MVPSLMLNHQKKNKETSIQHMKLIFLLHYLLVAQLNFLGRCWRGRPLSPSVLCLLPFFLYVSHSPPSHHPLLFFPSFHFFQRNCSKIHQLSFKKKKKKSKHCPLLFFFSLSYFLRRKKKKKTKF